MQSLLLVLQVHEVRAGACFGSSAPARYLIDDFSEERMRALERIDPSELQAATMKLSHERGLKSRLSSFRSRSSPIFPSQARGATS